MNEHTTEGGHNGPLVLAVDTSTAALAAALVRGGEVLREVQSLAERNHSVHTVSVVQTMLAESGVKPEELDGIAIGRGPGSYTGMRIAVSLGKTLAWVWQKPLVGISSLEALAYGVQQPDEAGISQPVWIIPIMDARRGQVYTASFASSKAAGSWTRLAPDGIRLIHDWVDELAAGVRQADAASRPASIWIVGELPQHEAEGKRLQELCAELDVRLIPALLEGTAVAALGAKRIAAGAFDDVHTFSPNYTQLTEAEVKLQEKIALQAAAEGAVNDDAN
ncbi:tRNA (adenosine(37)-N6)-threonylcarbamoyltransferase complex dimerization subunit type 1 TsaB [Paenibacillus sp. R14(2021)]|uniref:tRNA (adenosine(37)-N6)-threonylcarbamoyltransferase complex dimerization subunit type 1 TsaB n=1 Tax=Paenibacillus sp. R14(2021) TaxID=2859228 RepID=UPI001C612ECA|nr:tRNA (adenosine(37)-N6)-threonylcarbamoyltransferase complex dimerization subunit type 1 TsaB [Paenibacillus sp. R14(2021)]